MAIRPVEMQGMVQRSQDITGYKANEDNKPNVDQTNIFGNHLKELQQKQESVVKKQNADYNEQKYDAKEKGKNQYEGDKHGHREKQKREEEDDGTVAIKKKAAFDVRI